MNATPSSRHTMNLSFRFFLWTYMAYQDIFEKLLGIHKLLLADQTIAGIQLNCILLQKRSRNLKERCNKLCTPVIQDVLVVSNKILAYAGCNAMHRVGITTDVVQLVAKVTDTTILNAPIAFVFDDSIIKRTAQGGSLQIKILPAEVCSVTKVESWSFPLFKRRHGLECMLKRIVNKIK